MKPSFKTPLLLAALIAAGCGGSTSSGVPTNSVKGHTTLVSAQGTTSTAVDNSTSSDVASTTVTVNGAPTEAAVLAGDTVKPGDDVLLIPTVFPFKVSGAGRAPLDVLYKTNNGAFNPTGFRVSNGSLVPQKTGGGSFSSFILSYPNAGGSKNITIRVVGPLNVTGEDEDGETATLTVSNYLDFQFCISRDGVLGSGMLSTFPYHVDYDIPANGTTMYGKTIDMNFSTFAPHDIEGTLSIVYATGSKSQTSERWAETGYLYFQNLTQEASDRIPSTGIDHATIVTGPAH